MDTIDQWRSMLPQIQVVSRERFGITHSTLQPEDAAMGHGRMVEQGCGK